MIFNESKFDDVTVVAINCATTVSIHANNFKDYLFNLSTSENKKVVIDCRDVVYIDSSFIGSLVVSYKKFQQEGGELKIVCGDTHGHFWSFFQMTKTFSEMKNFKELNAAVNSFDQYEKVA